MKLSSVACLFAASVAGCVDFQDAQNTFCQNHPGICASTNPEADGGGPTDGGPNLDGGIPGGDGGTTDGGFDGGVSPVPGTPWLVVTGNPATTEQTLAGIAGLMNGGAVVTGSWQGGVDFGGRGQAYHTSPAGNGKDFFLSTYDGRGSPTGFVTFGGTGDDEAVAAGGDSAGALVAALNTTGSIAFGAPDAGGFLLSPGASSSGSTAMLKLGADGGLEWVQILTSSQGCQCTNWITATGAAFDPSGKSVFGGNTWGGVALSGLGGACRASYGSGASVAQSAWSLGFDADGGCLFSTFTTCNGFAPTTIAFAIDDVTGDFYLLHDLGGSTCFLAPGIMTSNLPPDALAITHRDADGGYIGTGTFGQDSGAYPAALAAHDGGIWAAWAVPNGPNGGFDITIAAVDPTGLTPNPFVQQTYGGSGNDFVRGLRFDRYLWLAGDFTGTPPFGASDGGADGGSFLAALDPASLAVVRAQILKSAGSLEVDALGSVDGAPLIGGQFLGSIDFGTDAGAVLAPTRDAGVPSLFFGRPSFP